MLGLPVGDGNLLQRRACGILHEEVGRGSLRVGDLQALDPRRRISDEILDGGVMPATHALHTPHTRARARVRTRSAKHSQD